jgi:hypothetical protein
VHDQWHNQPVITRRLETVSHMCQALSTKGEVTSGNEGVSSGLTELQVFILTGKPSFPQYLVSSVAHLTCVAS